MKDKINGAFHVSGYTVLQCDSNGHNPFKCCGDAVSHRRGASISVRHSRLAVLAVTLLMFMFQI